RLESDDRETNSNRADFSTSQFDHQIYFAHRPGPVYTITESPAEAEGPGDREGIYHAERIERKPLHSDVLPTLISPEMAADSARRQQQIPIITPIRTAPQPPSTTQNEIKDFEKENIPSSVPPLIEYKDHPELNNNLIEEIKLVETSENVELVDDNAPPQSPRLKRSPAMNLTTFTSDTTSATTFS
uniref:Uncharacterized protein n=1 Tax=Meloidogyne javanica TaxID=6303 RepID=A0A915MF94_MELJA